MTLKVNFNSGIPRREILETSQIFIAQHGARHQVDYFMFFQFYRRHFLVQFFLLTRC